MINSKNSLIFLLVIFISLGLDARKKNKRKGRGRSASVENTDLFMAVASNAPDPLAILDEARAIVRENNGNWQGRLDATNSDTERAIDIAWRLRLFNWLGALIDIGANFENLDPEYRPSMAWHLLDVRTLDEFETLRSVITRDDLNQRDVGGDLVIHGVIDELHGTSDLETEIIAILWRALELYIELGVNIDEPNFGGRTPFQMALDARNLRLMTYLVDHGARFSLQDIGELRSYVESLMLMNPARQQFQNFADRLILLRAINQFIPGSCKEIPEFFGNHKPGSSGSFALVYGAALVAANNFRTKSGVYQNWSNYLVRVSRSIF